MSAPRASSASGSGGVGGERSLDVKVVVLGHTSVGKTCMTNQLVRGQFSTHTAATVGAAFVRKTVKIGEWQVALQIWDTAGQERFRSMQAMYYRNAQAAVLVYDVSQPATFDTLRSWVDELQQHVAGSMTSPGGDAAAAPGDILMYIASNKSDLRESKPPDAIFVDSQTALEYAESIEARVFETSSKTGKGVEELFTSLARNLLERHLATLGKDVQFQSRSSANLNAKPAQSGGCCS